MSGQQIPTENKLDELNIRNKALEIEQHQLSERLAEVTKSLHHGRAEAAFLTNQKASISSLPTELLASIFQEVRDMEEGGDDGGEKWHNDVTFFSPVKLSHTTRHWRDIALKTPLLWNHITVAPATIPGRIAAHLVRSRECQLEITLLFSTDMEISMEEVRLHMTSIAPHMPRCAILHIGISSIEIMREIARPLVVLSAPHLHTLRVFSNQQVRVPTLATRVFSGGCPSLSSVVYESINPHYFSVPFDAVTKLNLDDTSAMTTRHFRDLVLAMPHLKHLVLRVEIAISSLPHMTSVTLPSLYSLTLDMSRNFPADLFSTWLFRSFRMPSLHELALFNFDTFDATDFFSGTEHLEDEAVPPLRCLAFRSSKLDGTSLMKTISAFPLITMLSFFHCNPTALFDCLSSNQLDRRGGLPWPQLHSIQLSGSWGNGVQSLCDFISFRVSVGHPIALLRITEMKDIDILMQREDWLRKHVQLEFTRNARVPNRISIASHQLA
jgi:hypothetical protein